MWRYPFVEHPRWCYWAQNTAERHRINQQKEVYLQKNPDDANLTFEELKETIEEGGEEWKSILARMQSYHANINGSAAYMHNEKQNLDTMMDQGGTSHFWWSFSQADN